MNKLFWIALTVLALALTIIQFIPSEPVMVPAQPPPKQRTEAKGTQAPDLSPALRNDRDPDSR